MAFPSLLFLYSSSFVIIYCAGEYINLTVVALKTWDPVVYLLHASNTYQGI